MAVEQVARWPWNAWPDESGLGGRMAWNPQLAALTPEDRTTQIQKTLTWMFGWSPDSNMPGLYGAKFWKEEADKAIQKRAERFTGNRQKAGTTQGGSE